MKRLILTSFNTPKATRTVRAATGLQVLTHVDITGLMSVEDLHPIFREMAAKPGLKGSPTTLGVAYDGWGPSPTVAEIKIIMALAE